MTICVDCRMIDASGVGVYLRGCLPWFLRSGNDFLLLGNAAKMSSFASLSNAKIVHCGVKPFSIQELFFFPRKTVRKINKAAAYFSPFFNIPGGIKIPVFSVIHDIIFPDMPELTSKTGLAVRMWFYRRALKKSQIIFTVSEFSKSRIEFHLGKSKPVIVTNAAIQYMFFEYRTKLQSIHKKETIVFIGNIKKHKGLAHLLDAFHLAKIDGLPHKLIIIGSKENFRSADSEVLQKINSLDHEAVSFTGIVSDEQLMKHLAEASLLVQPSLYEGFCLPPLEAMVLGTRALIADIPVLREVYAGYPVIFFRAGDSNDLKAKMNEQLCNRTTKVFSLPEHLARKYTFEKTASIILQNMTTLI